MEMGPQLKASSDRLEMPGIEPATLCLQGERFIHYTTTAPSNVIVIPGSHMQNEYHRLSEFMKAIYNPTIIYTRY